MEVLTTAGATTVETSFRLVVFLQLYLTKKGNANCETVSPYKKRKRTTRSYKELRLSQNLGEFWRHCLLLCREVILSNHLPVNFATLVQLNIYVAESHTLREMSLGIATIMCIHVFVFHGCFFVRTSPNW